MTNYNKEFRKEYGLTEENYQEFKDYYFNSHNSKVFNTLKELQIFIMNNEYDETFELKKRLKDWSQYKSDKLTELEAIENYLSEEMNKHLEGLNEYGYIYEVRNLALGDNSSFKNQDNIEYKVYQNSFSLDISDCVEGDSILEVKKSLSKDKLFEAINDLITNEIIKSNTSRNLISFEETVKVVYDDMMIRVDEGKTTMVIRIGIKVL